jgi:hypothetical protein
LKADSCSEFIIHLKVRYGHSWGAGQLENKITHPNYYPADLSETRVFIYEMEMQVDMSFLDYLPRFETLKAGVSDHLVASPTPRIILQPEKMDVAVKRLRKHVLKTTNAHATKEEMLDAVSSMRSVSAKILSMH